MEMLIDRNDQYKSKYAKFGDDLGIVVLNEDFIDSLSSDKKRLAQGILEVMEGAIYKSMYELRDS